MKGRLDKDVLKRSIDEIIRRHEALRTLFGMEGDNPVQIVIPPLEIELPFVDLSERPASAREKELDSFLKTEARKPFNLSDGPLVRVILLKLDEEDHVLFFNAHHIVFDVKDNGVGMDRATSKNIFSLFFSSKGDKGTGLGLFISNKIIRQHGGTIEVKSEPGAGTHMCVKIPKIIPESIKKLGDAAAQF